MTPGLQRRRGQSRSKAAQQGEGGPPARGRQGYAGSHSMRAPGTHGSEISLVPDQVHRRLSRMHSTCCGKQVRHARPQGAQAPVRDMQRLSGTCN